MRSGRNLSLSSIVASCLRMCLLVKKGARGKYLNVWAVSEARDRMRRRESGFTDARHPSYRRPGGILICPPKSLERAPQSLSSFEKAYNGSLTHRRDDCV